MYLVLIHAYVDVISTTSCQQLHYHTCSDKKYPVLGFGAKIRNPDGTMTGCQHCFPIYGGGVEVDVSDSDDDDDDDDVDDYSDVDDYCSDDDDCYYIIRV